MDFPTRSRYFSQRLKGFDYWAARSVLSQKHLNESFLPQRETRMSHFSKNSKNVLARRALSPLYSYYILSAFVFALNSSNISCIFTSQMDRLPTLQPVFHQESQLEMEIFYLEKRLGSMM